MKTTTKTMIGLLASLLLLLNSGTLFAQQGSQQGGQRGGPPQEAIDACDGKSDGDTVEFETRDGQTISGVCRERNGETVAVPENGQQGQGRSQNGGQQDSQMSNQGSSQRGGQNGPPQEAIDACSGKSDGASVSFETPRGDSVSGTCKEMQGQMVAVPENGRRGQGQGRGQQGGQQQRGR